MKLSSFVINNCFGFRDSGEINFQNENNFIYLLGRNSSGKSSLLNAISTFEVERKPNEIANFQNFSKTDKAARLIALFSLSGKPLDYLTYRKRLYENLSAKGITKNVIDNQPSILHFLSILEFEYGQLIENINTKGKVVVHKFGGGEYHFLVPDTGDLYGTRKKNVESAIIEIQNKEGNINLSGQSYNTSFNFNTFEDPLFFQFPVIDIFNHRNPLNESLPNVIVANWDAKENEFTKKFIKYLGQDDVNRFLAINDPEERDALLTKIRRRLKDLVKSINAASVSKKNLDLLGVRLDPAAGGIQITMTTDGKKSFYSHLSENTKFLFAYHLHAITNKASGNILLFDEPNNGFHPTAQRQMLKFLQDLGKEENQVIVSTHSEHLIDPDYLSSVRIMSSDKERNIFVKNHFYNQTGEKGDFLALQPIFDAIGYRYGNQLEITKKVIITEGVTDLLYMRAFNKILSLKVDLNIAPARGEGTIPHVVSFLISQGLDFKILIDTGDIKNHIQNEFGIDEKFFHEVPIPTVFIGKMNGSGIEDLFSKKDFESLLGLIGHKATASFAHVSNSFYIRTEAHPTDKRLLANELYEKAANYTRKSFEKETIDNFTKALKFCANNNWFSL